MKKLFNMRLEEGVKEKWAETAKSKGMSLSAYIYYTMQAQEAYQHLEEESLTGEGGINESSPELRPADVVPVEAPRAETHTSPPAASDCPRKHLHRKVIYCKICKTVMR